MNYGICIYCTSCCSVLFWLQRAQAAEAETKEILRHTQQQQAVLEQTRSERLSRQLFKGALDSVVPGSAPDDTDNSAQLLAQVLPTTRVM